MSSLVINECIEGGISESNLHCFLEKGNINAIKYICIKLKIDYHKLLYNELSYDQIIDKAYSFRDLPTIKYILNKHNKNYPADFYNRFAEDLQLRVANELDDLEGIKFFYNKKNTDYTFFYSADAGITHPKQAFYYAIKLGDYEGIQTIGHVSELKEDVFNSFIRIAYYKGQLDIAKYLIQQKVSKNKPIEYENIVSNIIIGLVSSNIDHDYLLYKQHIYEMKDFFSEQTFSNFINLIDILANGQNNTESAFLGTDNIYSNSYNNLYNISKMIYRNEENKDVHWTIQQVLNVIRINIVKFNDIKFLLPSLGSEPFFLASKLSKIEYSALDDPFNDHLIYLPLSHNYFDSSLIHEKAHAFFMILFTNNCLPYHKEVSLDLSAKYDEAVDKTISNFISIMTKGKYDTYNNDIESLFLLNFWYLTGKASLITNHIYSKLGDYFEKEGYNGKTKEENLTILYLSIFENYEWSTQLTFVMNRIFDYSQRAIEEKQKEFLVRVPELFYEGISPNIMKAFEPSIKYWEEFITPYINEKITKHYEDCLDLISKGTLNTCIVSTLSISQQETIFKSSAENGCFDCVERIYNDSTVIKNINIEKKISILSSTAYKIGPCVMLCKDNDKQCEYIKPHTGVLNYLMWMVGNIFYKCKNIEYNYDNYLKIITIIDADITNNLKEPELLGLETGSKDL